MMILIDTSLHQMLYLLFWYSIISIKYKKWEIVLTDYLFYLILPTFVIYVSLHGMMGEIDIVYSVWANYDSFTSQNSVYWLRSVNCEEIMMITPTDLYASSSDPTMSFSLFVSKHGAIVKQVISRVY